MKKIGVLCSGVLVAACGQAFAVDATVDGKITAGAEAARYGSPLFVQNQVTRFGNNTAGDDGQLPGDPSTVVTGVEYAIPMSLIGNPSDIATVRLSGFVSNGGYDFISNQVIGGLPANSGNLASSRCINFNNFAGNQFVNLNLVRVAGAVSPITLDGSATEPAYGASKFTQTCFTGFGNANGGAVVGANGSEIDQVFAVVWDNGTAGDTADDILYLTIAGNLESNFNKLSLFFDSIAGGQNSLRGDNPDVDFNGLNRMGANAFENGLTFDSGFAADYWLGITHGPTPTLTIFGNYAQLLTGGAGTGGYVGSAPAAGGGALTGGSSNGIAVSINNSNVAGVVGNPGSPYTTPNIDRAKGSEINSVYAYVSGLYPSGRLNLLVTGNLENSSENHLTLFYDVDSAGANDGQNQLRGDNPDISFNNLNRMGNGGNGAPGAGAGLKFDTGFAADYWTTIHLEGNIPAGQFVDAAVLRSGGRLLDGSGFVLDYGMFDGATRAVASPVNTDGEANCYGPGLRIQDQSNSNPLYTGFGPRLTQKLMPPSGPYTPFPPAGLLKLSIDNSNVGGVTGTDGTPSVADAANVTTGVELSIRMDELGWDGKSPIRIAGFVINKDRNFMSNQVIGGLPLQTPSGDWANNLGEPTLVDFSTITGTQYVELNLCVADFDDGSGTGQPDGGVGIEDLLYYLALFEAGLVEADVDNGDGNGVRDGGVGIEDLLYYLGRFEAGC